MRNFKQAAANSTIRAFGRLRDMHCVPIELNRDTLRFASAHVPHLGDAGTGAFLFQKTVIHPTLRQRGLAGP